MCYVHAPNIALEPGKGLHFLELTHGQNKIVYEGFEYEKCLTFHTDRLLAATKLRTEPYPAPPSVYNLRSF